ncbi:hypothetical protein MUK42_21469 [Musa troglodytarum]|uniref:Uncharacterized protein n=1 Tax=Musa troglodytarum TaxID=320322 RepID=A0A9E7G0V4_9LILI|nr:hypothetical protein MUK42_21469 [Musa troglodytarum]
MDKDLGSGAGFLFEDFDSVTICGLADGCLVWEQHTEGGQGEGGKGEEGTAVSAIARMGTPREIAGADEEIEVHGRSDLDEDFAVAGGRHLRKELFGANARRSVLVCFSSGVKDRFWGSDSLIWNAEALDRRKQLLGLKVLLPFGSWIYVYSPDNPSEFDVAAVAAAFTSLSGKKEREKEAKNS